MRHMKPTKAPAAPDLGGSVPAPTHPDPAPGKALPEQAGHQVPPLKPAKTQGAPRLKLSMNHRNQLDVDPEGDWSHIKKAINATELLYWMVMQLAVMGEPGHRISETTSNGALSFVSEMKPRDPAEMLLLTQMAAVHQATMTLARRLNHVETIPQQDAAERALNKLARTFARQMETLKRYRSKGQQVVRVERVNVEAGAQAVVGHVTHGGGADAET